MILICYILNFYDHKIFSFTRVRQIKILTLYDLQVLTVYDLHILTFYNLEILNLNHL